MNWNYLPRFDQDEMEWTDEKKNHKHIEFIATLLGQLGVDEQMGLIFFSSIFPSLVGL